MHFKPVIPEFELLKHGPVGLNLVLLPGHVPGTEDLPGGVPLHHPGPHLGHGPQLRVLEVADQGSPDQGAGLVGHGGVAGAEGLAGDSAHGRVTRPDLGRGLEQGVKPGGEEVIHPEVEPHHGQQDGAEAETHREVRQGGET